MTKDVTGSVIFVTFREGAECDEDADSAR